MTDENKNTERRSIVFSPALLATIEKLGDVYEVSRSEFVRRCVQYVIVHTNIEAVLKATDAD